MGDLDSHDLLCRHLTKKSECKLIAVDYSLAPEYKFPCSLEDSINAVNYIFENNKKNIKNLADHKNKDTTKITACLLDRPRHSEIIKKLKKMNLEFKMISGVQCIATLLQKKK